MNLNRRFAEIERRLGIKFESPNEKILRDSKEIMREVDALFDELGNNPAPTKENIVLLEHIRKLLNSNPVLQVF